MSQHTFFDAYFNRKQKFAFQLWVGYYQNKVREARDKDYAKVHYFAPYRGMGPITERSLPHTVEGDNPVRDAEVGFYRGLYIEFKEYWLLNSHNHVAEFIAKQLQISVNQYLAVLFMYAEDWEGERDAYLYAAEFIKSRRAVIKIVKWLALSFAMERWGGPV